MPRLFYLLYRLATDLISLISRFSDDFLAVVIRARELGQDVPREWFDYRSDLRNVPQQDGFPHDVVWPTHPDDAAQDEPIP